MLVQGKITHMVQSTDIYDNQGNKEVFGAIPASAKKILDLGCGAGNIGKGAIKTGIIWDGITISPDEAEIARGYYRKVILHNLENGLPLDQLDTDYDVCICSHVIEHIVWPDKLLHDINKLLSRSNGLFIMAVPNALYHEVRMKFLRGKFEYKSSGILDINHVRWYTFKTAKDLLTKNGFTIDKAWVEGKCPISRNIRKIIPAQLIKKLDNVSCRLIPGLLGYQLLYTGKPEKI
jgi:SAM-dependent methyltransferase